MDAFLFHSFSRSLSPLYLATFNLATLLRQNIVIGMAEKCVDFKLNFFDVKKFSYSKVAKSSVLIYRPFFGFSDFFCVEILLLERKKRVLIPNWKFWHKKVSESKVAKSAITSGYSDLEVEWKRKASISNWHLKKVAISKVDKIM